MNKIKNALISVSNKENLKLILHSLKKNKINIISSGGTYETIKKLGDLDRQQKCFQFLFVVDPGPELSGRKTPINKESSGSGPVQIKNKSLQGLFQ